MKKILKEIQKHLMSATSYMILFVVPGGVFYALSIMINGKAEMPAQGIAVELNQIGAAGLALFIPVLGGYIAYSIADKAGIGPGFIGAYLAREVGAGFLGGMLAGFLAGYTVKALKKIKLRKEYRTLETIFLYPLVGTLVSGGAILFLFGKPLAVFMNWMTARLNGMSGISKVPLGLLLGAMVGIDMGGPINKVAYTFAQTQVDTLPYLMGGIGAAGAVPPIGIGLATIFFNKKFSEGAIPFATVDPVRMIPIYTLGSAVACMVGFLFGVTNHAPWGGLIVLPVVEHRFGYIAAVVIGAMVVAVLTGILKKDYVPEKTTEIEEDIELTFEDF